MQNKTMMPLLLSERTRMICSLILFIVTMMMSYFHTPFIILTGFFLVQILVKVFSQDDTTNISLTENLIVGPLKVLTSILMIGIGLPSDDSGAGLAWIGFTLLFLCSGLQNMYWVFRSGRLAFHSVPTGDVPTTTRQQMKTEEAEDQLLADLFSVLDSANFPDSTEDGKK